MEEGKAPELKGEGQRDGEETRAGGERGTGSLAGRLVASGRRGALGGTAVGRWQRCGACNGSGVFLNRFKFFLPLFKCF